MYAEDAVFTRFRGSYVAGKPSGTTLRRSLRISPTGPSNVTSSQIRVYNEATTPTKIQDVWLQPRVVRGLTNIP